MLDLLGGKGSNLCEMERLQLRVPPGFVVSTQACRDYFSLGGRAPDGLHDAIGENVRLLERAMGRNFGSAENPLLVSVRSGARISMPGMMDTILNLGVNDDVVAGLASMMGDARPAYDAYRRFLQIYANVAMGVDSGLFEEVLSSRKERAGVTEDHELTAEELKGVCRRLQGRDSAGRGGACPSRPVAAAPLRRGSRVSQLEHRPGHLLPRA